jgi:Rps23 Pro-64 3,4-dihydroxylase Tpa1-like proline 4-hydroxylase
MQIWSDHLVEYTSQLHREFHSNEAKPRNLVSVHPFLNANVAEQILDELKTHEFHQWVAYIGENGQPKAHFQSYLDDKLYISVHRRSEHKIRTIDLLCESLGKETFCDLLKEMTGIQVSELLPFGSSICHLMGPTDFLREHTDFGPPSRRTEIVISLSFCKNWLPEYGGITEFKWDTAIQKVPTFNEAIIFAPHEDSMHCVFPIALHAPLTRFTMTLHYV